MPCSKNLGVTEVALYGSATGAQIAIEFAKAYPEKCRQLILDNAAHFTDSERDDIMSRYFPSIEAQADGAHLQTAWTMAHGLFKWFPWYAQDHDHLIHDDEPPTAMVHATALAYLTAGKDYAQAYRRAVFTMRKPNGCRQSQCQRV